MSLRIEIGRRIKQLREDMKLSQEDFAEKIAVDVSYLSGVENGKRNITLDTLDKITEKLNVDISNKLINIDTTGIIGKQEYISDICKAVSGMDIEMLKVLHRLFVK
ncbi:MAG: hypothetical protein A2015_03730 [Spirochaetes bacterium GWF1_31_7]|nr:MAG: hypothetical protein A2Y29_04960 [Spirochaetes bacterium GWE2_31_10]OHD53246.1 MAG: hypothetical protein A2015_03730 [Spirochaetes bacterium GWF1_31_7]HBD94723.1 hypothetical protein [Spirochaetia bacterium]HBI39051.1 hypothetical protein [Spirochaetia bacterium]